MARLVLSMDGLVLKEIPLDKQRTTIGRRAVNDIQIDNLAVSGEHAAIVSILDDAFLEDLDSTNGTLVNGQPVKKHVLRHNDVIEIGKYRLKYMADDTESSVFSRFSASEVLYDSASMRGGALPTVTLRLLDGPRAGKEFALEKIDTTFGKPGIQVARVSRRPDGVFLKRIEGDDPVIVNDKPMCSEELQVTDRDVIQLAGLRMELRVNEALE